MHFSYALTFALALAPSLVSAALFPSNSPVKVIDEKGFRKAMKEQRTSMVAFVANWCGHCQRMVPEYTKAAKNLSPLVPLYAVDCAEDQNKALCAQQDVKGFPTVKLFPRGKELSPIDYQYERTASGFFDFAEKQVPFRVKKIGKSEEFDTWTTKNINKPRAVLISKDKKVPLLWKVLGNMYSDKIVFAATKTASAVDFVDEEASGDEKKKSKVLVYAPGSTTPTVYEGKTKLDSLSTFFDSVLDGSAELKKSSSSKPVSDEL